jgi:hypothetical protein
MCHSAQAERLSGTYFFGGSGMDGPYIQHMITALKGAGIMNSYAARKEVWSQGSVISDGLSVMCLYRRDRAFTDFSHFHSGTGQFNLVGYSYGSIQVAQIATDYADAGGKIDHLALIASPIHAEFLRDLIDHPNIKHIHQITLSPYGDDMGPTQDMFDLIVSGIKIIPDFIVGGFRPFNGHFALVRDDEIGQQRLEKIAAKLHEVGLR